jgi:hypothetical protein
MYCLTAAGAYAATLQWTPSTGTVAGYKVYYGTSKSNTSNSKDVGNVISYNLDNLPLSENAQYFFCVSAYNSAGESDPCPSVGYTLGDYTPPVPPYGLTASIAKESSTASPDDTLTLSDLNVATGKAYKIRSGLANGNTAYIDRSYTFQNVPATLAGTTYIMTANDDKSNSSSQFLSFKANRNVTVYVAHDNRLSSKPDWLKSFSKTSLSLSTDVPMTIYQKSYSAGRIYLGGNNGVQESSMYMIAIK